MLEVHALELRAFGEMPGAPARQLSWLRASNCSYSAALGNVRQIEGREFRELPRDDG